MKKLIQSTKFDNIRFVAANSRQSNDGRRVFWTLLSASVLVTLVSAWTLQRALPVLLETVLPAARASEKAFVEIERARGLPVRGQSRASVRSQFGDPLNSKPAVGDPPISSWVYEGFTVYFEYDLVITSVAIDDHLPSALDNIQ